MNWEQILMTIVANYLDVVVVLLFVFILVILWKRGKRRQVIQVLRYLITKADDELGSKTGQIKKGQVIAELHERLPFVITILFSEQDISDLIDKLVEDMQEFLKNREKALSNTQEGVQ